MITESMYLKKPVLSQPVKGQFEQMLNAHYLEKLGYGEFHESLNAQKIENFLHYLPTYRKNLARCQWEDISTLMKKLEHTISTLVIK